MPAAIVRTHHLLAPVAHPHLHSAASGHMTRHIEPATSRGAGTAVAAAAAAQAHNFDGVDRHHGVGPTGIAEARSVVAVPAVLAPRVARGHGAVNASPARVAGAREVRAAAVAAAVVWAHRLAAVDAAISIAANARLIAAEPTGHPAANLAVHHGAAADGAIVSGVERVAVARGVDSAQSVTRAVAWTSNALTSCACPTGVARTRAVVAHAIAVTIAATRCPTAVFAGEPFEAKARAVEALSLTTATVQARKRVTRVPLVANVAGAGAVLAHTVTTTRSSVSLFTR